MCLPGGCAAGKNCKSDPLAEKSMQLRILKRLDFVTRGGSGYAANRIWLMAHYHTLATA